MERVRDTPYSRASLLSCLFANDFILKTVSGFEIGGGKVLAKRRHRSFVKSVEGMFYRCESLLAFDAETINTRGTENFKDMFAFFRRLEKLLVEHWDMNECRTMAGMFIRTGLHRETSQGLRACFPKSIARQRGAGCSSLKHSFKHSLRLNLRHSLSLW